MKERTGDDAVVDALLETLFLVHLAFPALSDEEPSTATTTSTH